MQNEINELNSLNGLRTNVSQLRNAVNTGNIIENEVKYYNSDTKLQQNYNEALNESKSIFNNSNESQSSVNNAYEI